MEFKTIEEYLNNHASRGDLLGFTADDLVVAMEKNPELAKDVAERYDYEDEFDLLYELISNAFNENVNCLLRKVGCKRLLVSDFVNGDEEVLEKIPNIEDFIVYCRDDAGTAYMAIEKIQQMANRAFLELNYQRAYDLYKTSYKCSLNCDTSGQYCGYHFPSYVFRNMASILMQRYASENNKDLLFQAFDLYVARLFKFYTEVLMTLKPHDECFFGGDMLLGNRDIVWNVEHIINLLFPNNVEDVRYELLLMLYLDALIEKSSYSIECNILDCYNNHLEIIDWYSYYADLNRGKELARFYCIDKDKYSTLPRKCIQTKAENGMASYQCLLGDLYRKGFAGVAKDEEQARNWYEKVICENKNEECVEYAKRTLVKLH